MGALGRYIWTFWRGRMPFSHACVSMGVAYLAIRTLPETLGPGRLVAFLALMLVLVVCISAARKVFRMLNDSAGVPGAVFLSICGFVVLMSGAIVAVDSILPKVAATTPYVPPETKVVLRDGAFEVTGTIDYQMLSDLKDMRIRNATIPLVRLHSDGGNVHAGRALGIFIAQAGLNTIVEGACLSACTLAYAGGFHRALGPEGKLGFHGYRQDHKFRQVTQTVDEAQSRDRAYLTSRGVSPEFVQRAYAVPASDIWLPSRAELQRAGVVSP